MRNRMIVLGLGLWVAVALALVPVARSEEAPEIELGAQVHPVASGLFGFEAVVSSGDASQLVFLAKENDKHQSMPATTPYLVTRTGDSAWSPPRKILSKGLATSVAFGNQDRWIVTSVSYFQLKALKNIIYLLFDKEKLGDLSGFKHRIEIYDAKSLELVQKLDSKSFGLKKSEILKHARVSPDGKWLAFYLHTHAEQRGVYLYNFANKRTWHFGVFDDKHPTWSPDGSKILFHSQKGGNSHADLVDDSKGQEQAYLGYYELDLSRAEDPKWKRVLMDDSAKLAVYHKHPAAYPGGDLLFFHRKEPKPEDLKDGLGSSRLHVRRLAPDSPVYKLTGLKTPAGQKVKKAKHVGAPTAAQSGIYFVGREDWEKPNAKGVLEEAPLQVFFLDAAAVSKLDDQLPKLRR